VTEASAHDEQVKDFVRTEMFESGVEQWKLQCVYNAADGVNDSAGEEPVECTRCQRSDNGLDRREANPAHGDVDHGGEPLGTVDPKCIDDDSDDRDGPNEGQKAVSDRIAENDQADRSVGTGDQYEDHHVVDLFEHFVDLLRDIEGVVDGAGSVKQDHTDDKDGDGDRGKEAGCENCFCDQRNRGDDGQDHCDEMGQGTARIFNI